jgi:hypothetical protein
MRTAVCGNLTGKLEAAYAVSGKRRILRGDRTKAAKFRNNRAR